jgi:hypothetical protein
MGKNQHVVPHGDGWAVRGAGSTRVTSTHSTQQDATDRARDIAILFAVALCRGFGGTLRRGWGGSDCSVRSAVAFGAA